MKTTKKTTTKKATSPRNLANDTEAQIDEIAAKHGDIGNAAQNFYYTIYYAPPFLSRVTLDTLNQAAAKLNLPPFTDEGDEAEQFTRLVNLFEATGGNFTLDAITPESERATSDRAEGKSLTCEQARAYARHLGMTLGDQREIGDALLVFRALVYSDERENLLSELQAGIVPLISGFDRIVQELVTSRADEWDRAYPPPKK